MIFQISSSKKLLKIENTIFLFFLWSKLSFGFEIGQPVYDPHGNHGVILSINNSDLITLKLDNGSIKTYKKDTLGVSISQSDEISIGDSVYTDSGDHGSVKCFYPNGKAIVFYSHKSGGVITPVHSLGLCKGQVGEVKLGTEVTIPNDRSGTVLCFYPSGKVLIKYSNHHSLPSRAIYSLQQLKLTSQSEEEPSDDDLCIVCFDTKINTRLKPCTHLILCRTCADKVETCPICRSKIDARIKE